MEVKLKRVDARVELMLVLNLLFHANVLHAPSIYALCVQSLCVCSLLLWNTFLMLVWIIISKV